MGSKRRSKRKRNYNTRLIKEDYSYYVEQVADLFGVDVATVRRWISKEGLKRLPKTRPHLIHSNALKAFHDKRQADRKKPCYPSEAFCCRCQVPRIPQRGTGTVTLLPNRSFRFKAKCSECGGIVVKNIGAAEWNGNHPLAVFLSGVVEEHNGACPAYRECTIQQDGKE